MAQNFSITYSLKGYCATVRILYVNKFHQRFKHELYLVAVVIPWRDLTHVNVVLGKKNSR